MNPAKGDTQKMDVVELPPPKPAPRNRVKVFLDRWLARSRPLIVLITLLCITLLVWWRDAESRLEQRRGEYAKQTTLVAQQMATGLENHFALYVRMLERFHQVWSEHFNRNEKAFRAEALRMYHLWPGLRTIAWIDSIHVMRWVEPIELNPDVEGLDLQTLPGRITSHHTDRSQLVPIVSSVREIASDAQGFMVDLPLQTVDRFDGFIQGTFQVPQFIDECPIIDSISRDFSLELRDGGKPFYALGHISTYQTVERPEIITRTVRVGTRTWELRLQPNAIYYNAGAPYSNMSQLIFGMSLSLILSFIVWQLQTRNREAISQRNALQESDNRAWETTRNLRLLNKLNQTLNQATSLQQVFNHAVTLLQSAFAFDLLRLYRLDDSTQTLRLISHLGVGAEHLYEFQRRELGSRLCGRAVQTGEIQTAIDVANDPRVGHQSLRDLHIHYSAYLPIKYLGKVYGLMVLSYNTDRKLQDTELDFLNIVSDILGMAIANIIQTDEVRSSREYFQTLFNATNEGIMIETLDHFLMMVNPRACQLLGHSGDELIGAPSDALFSKENQHNHLPKWRLLLQKDREIHIDADFRRKDGTDLPVEIIARTVPVVDQDMILTFFRDRTMRKQLEQDLLHAQKMESIGTLAGGIAHDFNNLLSTILGFGSLAMSSMEPNDPHYREVQRMVSAAERGALLVQQLLTLSRKLPAKPRPIGLNEVVDQVIHLLRHSLTGNIEVRIEKQVQLPAINADPVQWEQVLMNLCLNARDAMNSSGRPGVLTIQTLTEEITEATTLSAGTAPGRYVVLTVGDTGCGMDKATKERIFEPFFTTKQPGRGTGLGLTMVFAIVRSHQGYIDVDSAPERGTTFRIRIPATDAPIQTLVATSDEVPHGHETVLLVDDDLGVLDLIRIILERNGYNVLTARDAIEGLDTYKKNRDQIELVMTDLIMPNVNGAELIDQIRKIDPEQKIIVTTGYSVGTSTFVQPHGEPNAIIQKPFKMAELGIMVRQVLDGTAPVSQPTDGAN